MGTCLGRCLQTSDDICDICGVPVISSRNHSESVDLSFLHKVESDQCQEKERSSTVRDIPLQCLDARALLTRTEESTPVSSLDLEWEHETLPVSMADVTGSSCWPSFSGKWQGGGGKLEKIHGRFQRTTLLDDAKDPSEASPHSSVPFQGSDTDWSRVSSANSLEWDNVQNSFNASPPASDVDTDTQMLLCEIERLTIQTLSETGLKFDS